MAYCRHRSINAKVHNSTKSAVINAPAPRRGNFLLALDDGGGSGMPSSRDDDAISGMERFADAGESSRDGQFLVDINMYPPIGYW